MFADSLGTPPVRLKLPTRVMSGITGLYSGTLAKLLPNLPQRLTPGAINVLRMRRHADTTKAREELGYVPTDLASAVHEAFEFFYAQGMIPNPPVPRVSTPSASSSRPGATL